MRRSLVLSVLAGLILASATPAVADAAAYERTSFSFTSEEGDWVGQGGQVRITPDDGSIEVGGSRSYLTVYAESPEQSYWVVTIAAPRDRLLGVGHYVDAERAAFRTGRAPGLDVSGDHRGCNEVYGEFWINQIRSDATGAITHLDARFVQHCETADAPALRGRVRYRAVPLSYTYRSDPGDWVGAGLSHTFENATSTFALTGDRNGVSIHVDGDRERWDLSFWPVPGEALDVGLYTGALRGPVLGYPGLEVTGNSRGCNEIAGSFEILVVEFRRDGSVRRLRATFEQHCEGGDPALFGEIRFRA